MAAFQRSLLKLSVVEATDVVQKLGREVDSGTTSQAKRTPQLDDLATINTMPVSDRYSTLGVYPITDCVVDKCTGLMWEGKTVSGTRAGNKAYTNYGDRRIGDVSAYVDSVNAMRLCGYSDWRLPTKQELESLIIKDVEPSIDNTWFPYTKASCYWTTPPYAHAAVPYSNTTRNDSLVCFDNSHFNRKYSGYGHNYVRLVRSNRTNDSKSESANHTARKTPYIVSSNQPKTNLRRNLIWMLLIVNAVLFFAYRPLTPRAFVATTPAFPVKPTRQEKDEATKNEAIAIRQQWEDAQKHKEIINDTKPKFSHYSTVRDYPITDCVKDNTTGLTWEGKPLSGERASSKTYTNFGDQSIGDASAYVDSVNAIRLCNYSDWRLPTKDELAGLIVERDSPSIDSTWFPNTQAQAYWTASRHSDLMGIAWFVDFYGGGVFSYKRSNGSHVRLVR